MTAGEKLLWDMKVTAGARFNAANRLASKDRISNLSLALFSGLLLSISVIGLAFSLEPAISKGLAVSGIAASVMSLIFSMKVYADKYAVEAEQMHRCSLEINEIRRICSLEDLSDTKAIISATEKYNAVLQKYSLNHADADFKKYKFEHRWEFEDLKGQSESSVFVQNTTRKLAENLFERLSALLGVAGIAAALAGLISAILGS
jgi:SMODS and SLOG-associating 2TM effector domain family 5